MVLPDPWCFIFLSVYIGFSKICATASPAFPVEKMRRCGIDGKRVRQIWPKGRSHRAARGLVSSWPVCRGVHQGSDLGSVLAHSCLSVLDKGIDGLQRTQSSERVPTLRDRARVQKERPEHWVNVIG